MMSDKLNWYTVGGIVFSLIGVTVMCYGLRKLYVVYNKQLKLGYLRKIRQKECLFEKMKKIEKDYLLLKKEKEDYLLQEKVKKVKEDLLQEFEFKEGDNLDDEIKFHEQLEKNIKQNIILDEKDRKSKLGSRWENEFKERHPDNIYDPEFRNWVKEMEEELPGRVEAWKIVDYDYLEQLSD